jgi:signal transduction histidine kinase
MTEVREEFLGLLAHELRTPIAAIIGYHDLMREGILGEIDPRTAEALERIRSSADQLLTLVASLGEAATDDLGNLHVELEDVDPRAIVEHVLDMLQIEANGRATNVVVDALPVSGVFHTDCERVERGLVLMLHAAIKCTAGGEIRLQARVESDVLDCRIRGARLEPARDVIERGPLAAHNAAAMRLGMARQTIAPLGGTLTLHTIAGDSVLTMRVPSGFGVIDGIARR